MHPSCKSGSTCVLLVQRDGPNHATPIQPKKAPAVCGMAVDINPERLGEDFRSSRHELELPVILASGGLPDEDGLRRTVTPLEGQERHIFTETLCFR